MGQRSQIYIAYNRDASTKDMEAYVRKGDRVLVARYFSWNYGARMVSRAKGTMEWLSEYKDDLQYVEEKIHRIADINFDFRDIALSTDIIEEWKKEFNDQPANDTIFKFQDNNDGKLFISVEEDGTIKYCFSDGDITKPMTAKQYMNWDHCQKNTEENDGSRYAENCSWIKKNAVLMSSKELKDFISCSYSNVTLEE